MIFSENRYRKGKKYARAMPPIKIRHAVSSGSRSISRLWHEVGNVSRPEQLASRGSGLLLAQMTTTLVPTLTRPYRSITSSLRMRMQPDDTCVPIVHGSLDPWIR